MRRKRKTIVKIGRLLNLKRFICKKAQFVIYANENESEDGVVEHSKVRIL